MAIINDPVSGPRDNYVLNVKARVSDPERVFELRADPVFKTCSNRLRSVQKGLKSI